MQIENWLYNGGPEPQEPIIKRIIQSYGGWERLGMTTYQHLRYLLRDIEARFEAIVRRNHPHSYIPEGDIRPHQAPPLSSSDIASLADAVEQGLDTLGGKLRFPVARDRARW